MSELNKLTPSDEQQAILNLGLTSIKVRAGAGTGKTTTVAMVIANLIENHGVEPEQVLGITFTNKAAAELADRVRTTVGADEPGRQAEVHTYHGFASQVLSEFGALAGVDSGVRVITPTFARQLLRESFSQHYYQHLNMTWSGTVGRILKLGDRLGDHLRTPEDILALSEGEDPTSAGRAEMAEALTRYNEDKRRLRVVDYSDMVSLSARIMQEHPDLALTIRQRYRVLVLDEYQDTNPAQRILLSSIFGRGFPVIAVGDEDQTIYEWRGASAENFEMFAEHFPTPDGEPAHLRHLTLNRRSVQPILDIANEVRAKADPNADRLQSALDASVDSEILTYVAADAVTEAEWIASRFIRLHEQGVPWKEMAVLFRKNRHFAIVVNTFGRHEIPVEVANVGGLLAVPEVAEVIAWLKVIENPEDSAALIQILFGSRYRLGMADLIPLVRVAARAHPESPDSDDPEPVTLIEAIETAEQTPGLRPQALESLQHFHDIYREVLVESQGLALVEVCRMILDRTGAWRDVEALPRNRRLTARLNLYRLLDLAEDWSPLRGRPSIAAFLDYLKIMEEEPSDELDAARLSGEDAVTLVTVHRAKGLEWDNVAIPAVLHDDFPSRPAELGDPARQPHALPPELRLDSVLAQMPDMRTHRDGFLRDIHYRQEWRVAYVALTRARKRLYVSRARWYGLPEPPKNPKEPSDLWKVIEQHPMSTEAGREPAPERPEILGATAEGPAPDPLFDQGWEEAVRTAVEKPDSVEELASTLGLTAEHRDLVDDLEGQLFSLAEVPGPEPADEGRAVSVTGLVTYAQCPKRYYWSDVDPLPRKRNPAATRGTEIHRQIELHQRGHIPLDLVDDELYDAVEGSSQVPAAYDTYLSSRFADARATLVETPFAFDLPDDFKVRGRMDAVYVDNGHWEVVDFKSGRLSTDPSRIVQLQAYAIATTEVDFGIPPPDEVTVTFAYLGGGGAEDSHRADREWIARARTALASHTAGITNLEFGERPGEWCGNCDYLRFCAPGRTFLNK